MVVIVMNGSSTAKEMRMVWLLQGGVRTFEILRSLDALVVTKPRRRTKPELTVRMMAETSLGFLVYRVSRG